MTDPDDLIARLRDAHANSPQRIAGSMIFSEAADALEALRDEVARKDAALRFYATGVYLGTHDQDGVVFNTDWPDVEGDQGEIARAALKHQ